MCNHKKPLGIRLEYLARRKEGALAKLRAYAIKAHCTTVRIGQLAGFLFVLIFAPPAGIADTR